jgi:hypothetical protein
MLVRLEQMGDGEDGVPSGASLPASIITTTSRLAGRVSERTTGPFCGTPSAHAKSSGITNMVIRHARTSMRRREDIGASPRYCAVVLSHQDFWSLQQLARTLSRQAPTGAMRIVAPPTSNWVTCRSRVVRVGHLSGASAAVSHGKLRCVSYLINRVGARARRALRALGARQNCPLLPRVRTRSVARPPAA